MVKCNCSKQVACRSYLMKNAATFDDIYVIVACRQALATTIANDLSSSFRVKLSTTWWGNLTSLEAPPIPISF
jgi:hypothetical protein